jgi:MoaA/NifB/PqqE/SkfB family radical SAM enzyme
MTPLAELNWFLSEHEFKQGVTVVKSRPTWITIETTAVCNLRCVQCPREYLGMQFKETHLDPSIWHKITPFIPYMTHLQLHGLGEPLLADLFWQIVNDDKTKAVDLVDVNSNGTLFTERNVERLLNSGLNFLNISLDAATAPTYKKIRGGNFDKVIAGIRRLTTRRKELGSTGLRIWMNMTLMMENIRELPLFIDLACDLGVDAVDAWHLNMRSDGAADDWRLTHDNWTFVYNEQHLSNAPTLSNEMVRRAQAIAEQRGFNFKPRSHLWLPE